MRNRAIVVGLTAGVIGGGAAMVALGGFGGAGAVERSNPFVVAQADTTDPAAQDDATDESTTGGRAAAREDALAEALAPLVEDGTITQAQADAVVARLVEAGPMGGGHHGGRGYGARLDTVAEILGMEEADVRAALEDGTTLAALAEQQGVGRQALVDGLVAEVKAHLDEEVAEGDLTQQEADERLATASERIGEMVDGTLPVGGPMRDGRGGRGGHHHGDDTTSATTTTTA